MEERINVVETVLPLLQQNFVLIPDQSKCNNDTTVLRSTITTESEILNFVNAFSSSSNTHWIVYKTVRHQAK